MASVPVITKSLSTLRKECFVTVGATASFKSMIDATSSPSFLETLLDLGYTRLTIQCGPDLEYFEQKIRPSTIAEIEIKSFDFNKFGLGEEMRVCKALPGKSREGVVICHAGK